MLVRRTDATTEVLADPAAPIWDGASAQIVNLMQAPPAMQPTRYIASKWRDQPYGGLASLAVQGLHNGTAIAFRLRWADATKNAARHENTDFPDAAALLFPLVEDAPLFMGGEGKPVNLWYWRADHPERARSDVASGIGSSRVVDDQSIAARAVHDGEGWTVVLHRALRVDAHAAESVQLEPGQRLRTTFAVWEGGNLERAGIKAFAPQWVDLAIEA
jgi:DMSO reductase family type II enzyme heme b subunit